MPLSFSLGMRESPAICSFFLRTKNKLHKSPVSGHWSSFRMKNNQIHAEREDVRPLNYHIQIGSASLAYAVESESSQMRAEKNQEIHMQ